MALPQHHKDASYYSRANYGSASAPQAKSGKNNFWNWVFRISIVVLIAAVLVIAGIIAQYIIQRNAYDDLHKYTQIEDTATVDLADLTVDWDSLREINPDIVGWIYIPDTVVNYPIVQGDSNDEYLRKSFDGTTGPLATAGTLFIDSSNTKDFSDRNTAIYGHHMHDGSMFEELSEWVDPDAFNQHRDIYVLTPSGNFRLETFAVVKTTGYDAIVETSFTDDDSYTAYIQDKLDRSVVTQAGTVLSAEDVQQSFMFSTCEYSQTNGRAVVFAAVAGTTIDGNPWVSASDGSTGLTVKDKAALQSENEEE